MTLVRALIRKSCYEIVQCLEQEASISVIGPITMGYSQVFYKPIVFIRKAGIVFLKLSILSNRFAYQLDLSRIKLV